MNNNKVTKDHMTTINNIDKTVTIGIIHSEIKLLPIMHNNLW